MEKKHPLHQMNVHKRSQAMIILIYSLMLKLPIGTPTVRTMAQAKKNALLSLLQLKLMSLNHATRVQRFTLFAMNSIIGCLVLKTVEDSALTTC